MLRRSRMRMKKAQASAEVPRKYTGGENETKEKQQME